MRGKFDVDTSGLTLGLRPTMPVRVQRSRRKGDRKPENTRAVSRPSKWGNPFRVGSVIDGVVVTQELAVDLFRDYIREAIPLSRGELDLGTLRGKNLACWCRLDQACHADVLLELANG